MQIDTAGWQIWIGGLLLLWLPGVFLHRLLRLPSHPDWLVTLAIQLGLGLALWPLLLLWSSTLGWRWTASAAQLTAGGWLLAGTASLLWPPGRWAGRWTSHHFQRQRFWATLFACVLALTLATRLLHIRGLALPAWVDSVHHVAIIRLLLDTGALPTHFDPYIPGGLLLYHWGYHAGVAWLAWLYGRSDGFEVADLVLHYGQLLNSLTVVMIYAGARQLFASRRAGLLAAALVGLVSWFPAYFLTWGRYTHLAGVLLMVPALITLWQLRKPFHPGTLIAAGLLLAGLALVHVRVALLAALLAATLAVPLLLQARPGALLRWGGAALAALLLTLPWWLWLAESSWARSMISPRADNLLSWAAYNQPDWGLLWAPRNSLLVAASSAGVSWLFGWPTGTLPTRLAGAGWLALLAGTALWAWRHPTLRRATTRAGAGWLLLAGWMALATLLLQAHHLGLPSLRFIHINAAIITLFVPLSLASGGLLAWLSGVWLPPQLARISTGLLALAIAVSGAQGMRTLVNPATVLATPADRVALTWIRDHVPADARFAVPMWRWMKGVYAGSDGGYWIPVLTDRASILPPALYNEALPRNTVGQMNELFARIAETGLADADLLAELAAQGVTHLYQRDNDSTTPLENNNSVQLLYRQQGVSVYQLAAPASP
jgi:hypothetical protein